MKTEELRKTKILERGLQGVNHLIQEAEELSRGNVEREERIRKGEELLERMNSVLQAVKPLRDRSYDLEEKRDDVSDLVERLSTARVEAPVC